LALGIPLALWGSRLLVTQLHGVGRLDPIAYGAACVLFCMVAALAMYLPARQAASVQPLEVMRPG
jgi:putative ABC transport system permease protein